MGVHESPEIEALRRFLDAAGPGRIDDKRQLDALLSRAWPGLHGSGETAMESWKLARIEDPQWAPPVLSFKIERHGATVNGSTRAEIQSWDVDLDTATAEIGGSTHRQLYPMAPRLKMAPLAAEIMRLIDAGADDPRLKWSADLRTVRVVASKVIPSSSGYKQTVEGRRRRFQDAMNAELAAAGWVQATVGWTRSESG